MAEIPLRYLVHEVTVETFQGSTAYGPQHAAPATRQALVDEKRQLVRDGNGQEVVSETRLFLRRVHAADFAPESRVLLPSGRTSTVISVADRSDGGLGAWQHAEVTLR